MAYQVLARKWRPRSFHEMVGQTHVLKALINALDNQRLHHAYLFTGTRGVGKTTLSRIFAKCLNCEQGISATPCGVCSICREVDSGRFVDLIEIDAASRTKVEDTREILDNVQYAPARGRYKIYLIDEVHMLSTHSFNALLKTLEEPPEHVKFLLATTDPHKLPVTILSRCLQFSLKNIAAVQIIEYLKFVLDAEQVIFDEQALRLIGRAADGSMRDAMSLTDQAIAFGNGKVLLADVRSMLGAIDRLQVYPILVALFAKKPQEILFTINTMAAQDPHWNEVLTEILRILHKITIAQIAPHVLDNTEGDEEVILELARKTPAEDIQLYYQIAMNGRRDLLLAPDLRSGFEMTLLRMLAFTTTTVDIELDSIVAVTDGEARIEKESSLNLTRFNENDKELEAASVYKQACVEVEVESTDIEKKELVVDNKKNSIDLAEKDANESSEVLSSYWFDLFDRLKLNGILSTVVSNFALTRKEDNRWLFHLDDSCAAFFNETHIRRVEEAISSVLGKEISIDVDVRPNVSNTPAKHTAYVREQAQIHAEQDFNGDVHFLSLQEKFAAVVITGSIEPILKGESK